MRNRSTTASRSPAAATPSGTTPDPASKPEAFNISSAECVRRLRLRGQPILLFGESERERRLRLRALELLDEKGGAASRGGQNDFKKAMEEMEAEEKRKEAERRNRQLAKKGEERAARDGGADGASALAIKEEPIQDEETVLDLDLVKTNPKKVYPLIYYALKVCTRLWIDVAPADPPFRLQKVLKEWEQAMDERPDSVKQTMQGKLAAATQVQAGQYLKPLMKSLRQRVRGQRNTFAQHS